MKVLLRGFLFSLLALCMTIAAPLTRAQSLPDGPVTIVVPFPPGGVTDLVARVVATRLGEIWKQPVVINNKPGAGGDIGAATVARARGDGRTFLFAGTSIVINSVMQEKVPYALMTTLLPVSLVADLPFLIVVNSSLPVKSVPELVSYAKQHPGTLNFGSGGIGTTPHVAGELFKQITGIDMVHVPFKGAAAATTELAAGRIHVMVDSAQGFIPFIQKGAIRALATPRSSRIPNLLDIPTMRESSSFDMDVSSWLSLWAPGGTSPALMDRVNRDVAKVLAEDRVRAVLAKQSVMPVGNSRQDFEDFIKRELAKWKKTTGLANATAL